MNPSAPQETLPTELSVVVPTYREAENIPLLLERLDAALRNRVRGYEALIVDDNSPDGTREAVSKLEGRFPVRLRVRTELPRCLSSSVIEGIRLAAHDRIVVMDADLQHPPERIPDLVRPLLEGRADFVLGSRYTGGASNSLGWLRRLNSVGATWLARPLTRTSDPMSGFFCFDRRLLSPGTKLDPVGYKIALEILVKTGCRRVAEVPIEFGLRARGESKLSLREQTKYLKHLLKLYRFRFLSR